MGVRTLEARLTARLVAPVGAVLMAVGIAAVLVTQHVLNANDLEAARGYAASARSAFEGERAEGDSVDDALREVAAGSEMAGVRISLWRGTMATGAVLLPTLAPGTCAIVDDDRGTPWQTCAVASGPTAVLVAGVPVAAHRAVVRALSRGMAAVVAMAIFAIWIVVRRALRGPIAELEALVRWTAQVVDADPAVGPPSAETREIVQLESAFDTLVRRLLDALARERASSAHIAHELRTPLTAIVAELECVRAPDEATHATLQRVLGDVGRFADVIDAILVLSEGARGNERGHAVVNLADVVRELAPPGARVEAPDEALVETDERLLRLAVRNLVENARKYAAGARLLRVSREGATARLSVVDDGPGLDAGTRDRMFDRYWRGSADGEGRGLGLALVRAVAERHGGRAEAREGDQGRGLDVSMTFNGLISWNEEAPAIH
jgi:signal transduction histidine kinase